MYLRNKKGDILCSYSVDKNNKVLLEIEGIKIPNDFMSIASWIRYSRELITAFDKLKLIIE